jgi:hypothetical protein
MTFVISALLTIELGLPVLAGFLIWGLCQLPHASGQAEDPLPTIDTNDNAGASEGYVALSRLLLVAGIVATLSLHAPEWSVLLGALLLHLQDHTDAEDTTPTLLTAPTTDGEVSGVLAALVRISMLSSALWASEGTALLLSAFLLGNCVYLDFAKHCWLPDLFEGPEEYTYVPLSTSSKFGSTSLSRALFGGLAVIAAGQNWPFLALLLIATVLQLPDSEVVGVNFVRPASPLTRATDVSAEQSNVQSDRQRPWMRRAWVRTAHGRSSGGFPLSPPPNSKRELAWAATRAAQARMGMPAEGVCAGNEASLSPDFPPPGLSAIGDDGTTPSSDPVPRTHEWVQVITNGVVVDLKLVRVDPPRRSYNTGPFTGPLTYADDPSASCPLLPVSSAPVMGRGSLEAGGGSDVALGSDKKDGMFSTGQPEGVESIVFQPPENRQHRIIFDWRNNSESSVHSSLVSRVPQGPIPPRDYCMVRISPSHLEDGSLRDSGTIRIPWSNVTIHNNDEAENRINVHQVLHWDVCEIACPNTAWTGGVRTASGIARTFDREGIGDNDAKVKTRILIVPTVEAGGEQLWSTARVNEDWTEPCAEWLDQLRLSWPRPPLTGSREPFGLRCMDRLRISGPDPWAHFAHLHKTRTVGPRDHAARLSRPLIAATRRCLPLLDGGARVAPVTTATSPQLLPPVRGMR